MVLKSFFYLFSFAFFFCAQSQEILISLDSLNLKGKKLLFEDYHPFGQQCFNKSNGPEYCSKEIKLFDKNIDNLSSYHHSALTYLYSKYAIIDSLQLKNEAYADLDVYRYFIQYKPSISKNASSCFSNPGALLISFYLYDRLVQKKYKIDLRYDFFICDIQILVNAINTRLIDIEYERILKERNIKH